MNSIALDKHETSIEFANSYVENDMDCNATDSHFEHHHNARNECLKWVEKAEFNHFELQSIDQKECLMWVDYRESNHFEHQNHSKRKVTQIHVRRRLFFYDECRNTAYHC